MQKGGHFAALEQPQALAPAGWLFAATVDEPASFSLAGCTVAPGFDFADFEMPGGAELCRQYPEHRALIQRLGKEYFWHLGYVLLQHPGREAEGLAYLRRGLGHWPWSPSWWKTYLVSWLRVATGLRSKAHPQPVRSA